MELAGDFVGRLRAVFDLCDIAQQGYISVEHFQELAKEHFGAAESGQEDIDRIIRVLDPTGDGNIHFEDFCEGVKQILELQSPSTPPILPGGDQHPKLYNIGSEETLVPLQDTDDTNSCGTHETSEVSTFNEYDMMTDDDVGMSVSGMSVLSAASSSPPGVMTSSSNGVSNGVGGGGHHHHRMLMNGAEDEDRDSAISARSMDYSEQQRRDQEVTSEEDKFEDFGLVNESPAKSSDMNGYSTPDRPHTLQIPARGLTNGYNNYYEDVSRLQDKRDNWIKSRTLASLSASTTNTSRRLTSSALASHLLRAGGSSTGHSRRSSCSDDFYDDIDGSFTELTDKVRHLETQLSMLTDKQLKSDEKQCRLKEENSYLVERVHILEEQLREIEMRSAENLEDERRKHRELLSKTDKEKSQEIELLSLSLKTIDKEYKSLKEEAPRLRTENERLRKENAQLEERLRHAQNRMSALADEHEEAHERLLQEKEDIDKERRANAELLDELGKELEELRTYRADAESKRQAAGLVNDVPRSQRRQMEAHIVALRQENSRLREQQDELQASLLSASVREGLNTTLANEMHTLPKDEAIPPKKGIVRGISYITGYYITPIDNNNMSDPGCTVAYVTQSDPKGKLPVWVVNKLTQMMAPKVMSKIHKACKGYPTWKVKHNPQLKPWLYPEQLTLPRLDPVDIQSMKETLEAQAADETNLEETDLDVDDIDSQQQANGQ